MDSPFIESLNISFSPRSFSDANDAYIKHIVRSVLHRSDWGVGRDAPWA
jgi:hypothetical protein